MTDLMVMELSRNALTVTLLISAPTLGLAMVVGLAVSLFQAVTQINESTLTFVPKILAIFAGMALFGAWMMNTMLTYTTGLFGMLPMMVR